MVNHDKREKIPIGGANGLHQDIKNISNLRRYELLNFNPLGEGKYKALEKENTFEKCRPFGEDTLKKLEDVAKSKGIKVKVV